MYNYFVWFGVRGSGFGVVLLLSAYCLVLSAPVVVHAETLRDPFTFGPREGTAEGPEMVLMGVLWDAAHPLAMLGDEAVGIGDRVADWQVVEIRQDGIVIQRGDRREVVSIGKSIPAN